MLRHLDLTKRTLTRVEHRMTYTQYLFDPSHCALLAGILPFASAGSGGDALWNSPASIQAAANCSASTSYRATVSFQWKLGERVITALPFTSGGWDPTTTATMMMATIIIIIITVEWFAQVVSFEIQAPTVFPGLSIDAFPLVA